MFLAGIYFFKVNYVNTNWWELWNDAGNLFKLNSKHHDVVLVFLLLILDD